MGGGSARWERPRAARPSPSAAAPGPQQQRATAARLQLHAFELQPSNEKLLRQLTALTGAPIEVHGVAVSNYSGVVYTRDSGHPGYESVAAQRSSAGGRSIARRTTTIDDFLAERQLAHVQLVSIDTEGWDGLASWRVMECMRVSRPHACTQQEAERRWASGEG